VTEPVDTEKGVPDGFFLTSNAHKIHFGGAYDAYKSAGLI